MWLAAAAAIVARGPPRRVPTSPEPPAFFPDAGGLLLRSFQGRVFVDDRVAAEGNAQQCDEG